MRNGPLLPRLLPFTPVVFALVLMAPRLAEPHFGFFDDAITLQAAQRVADGEWQVATGGALGPQGRARPVYWLYNSALYVLAGDDPFWFFVGNTILLCATVAAVIALAGRLSSDGRVAWVAGTLFILSGPVIENAYTLSKPELQQILWILLSLWLAHAAEKSEGPGRIVGIGLAAVAVFVACNTKETAVLLLPVSLAWLGIGWILPRLRISVAGQAYLADPALFFACLAGVAAYVASSSAYTTADRLLAGYASGFQFDPVRMLATARVWVDWLNRDFLYLAPPTALVLLRFRRFRPRLGQALPWAIWMGLWVVVYIPWVFTPEYYLLPAAVGAALLGALLLSANLEILHAERGLWRPAAAAALGLGGLLLLLTLPNNYTNGRLQLAIDSANAEMLEHVLGEAPQGAVVLFNLQDADAEYATTFPVFVNELGGRDDLTVRRFAAQDPAAEGWDGRAVELILPVFENQFTPSVRVGVFAHDAAAWNENARPYMGDSAREIYRAVRQFTLFNIDSARLFCPLVPAISYCAVPYAPLDRRVLEYGWAIYRLSGE